MATEDYRKFCSGIDKSLHKAIAYRVSRLLPKIIAEMYVSEDRDRIDATGKFFSDALSTCGICSNKGNEQFFNLISNWAKTDTRSGGSAQLIEPILYYLYTIQAGKVIVAEVENGIFKNSFEDMAGFPVPGGWIDPSEEKKREENEMLALVREIHANQKYDAEQASILLLLTLAQKFDSSITNFSQVALESYLSDKIEEWHQLRRRNREIEAADDADRDLLAKALAATDQGDFAAADILLAESQNRFSAQLEAAIRATVEAARSKAERLALRAGNAALADDYIAAAAFYDNAHDAMRLADDAASIAYAHHAANELYREGSRSTRVQLSDVASRYRELVMRAKQHPELPASQHYGPLMSYCAIQTTLLARGQRCEDFDSAEKECRDCLEEYKNHPDPLVPAIIRSVLGGILTIGSKEELHQSDSTNLSNYISNVFVL